MLARDTVIGTGCTVGGALIVHRSMQLGNVPGSYAGPGLFPTLIGIALCICGILVLAPALRQKRKEEKFFSEAGERLRLVEVTGLVIFLIACAPKLGFILTSWIMMMAELCLRKNSLLRSAVVSTTLVVIVWGLFTKVLRVPLPVGPWGW
ncbi:MAG TPA: tripartite tricarboxylate transporter TctB family protein [Thermosynergistes sp.]|nr:tripartite tricarboxylate transporter TctB family protein [Thermosynergistes sp.]